jgi:serine/threonine protein kinase
MSQTPGGGATTLSGPDPFPGEYRFVRLLGEGAFGKVWLAEDLHLGRQVAVKTVKFSPEQEGAEVALQTLRKDARLLGELQARSRHPNIVHVHTWREARGEHYLVMEYIEGTSLDRLVSKQNPLPWEKAARYVADVGEALLAVHSCGVVHRDIKPANILLDKRRDEAVLTDFGISARILDARTICGTPSYMAPEVFEGRARERSDVYSLAATLFQLSTGEVPFRGADWNEQRQLIARGLPEYDPRFARIPKAVEGAIRQGLEANPEHRLSLQPFLTELRRALNQSLADSLSSLATAQPGSVELSLVVRRQGPGGEWQAIASTQPSPGEIERDVKPASRQPPRVKILTGELLRLEVTANQTGYVTVFNVGPTGTLNLLYPDPEEPAQPGSPPDIHPGKPLPILEVVMEPPVGQERLFAIWSPTPQGLRSALAASGPGFDLYDSTRNMVRVRQQVSQNQDKQWHTAVIALDHRAAAGGP